MSEELLQFSITYCELKMSYDDIDLVRHWLKLWLTWRHDTLPGVQAVQGDCQWHLKTVEILTGHVSPQSIVTETDNPTNISTNQSQY